APTAPRSTRCCARAPPSRRPRRRRGRARRACARARCPRSRPSPRSPWWWCRWRRASALCSSRTAHRARCTRGGGWAPLCYVAPPDRLWTPREETVVKLTGERPIEGQTPDSLLALHAAGYREVRSRVGSGRMLDLGCGLGDGTATF